MAAAATKPVGFAPFWPGTGGGGLCFPVDPDFVQLELSRAGAASTLVAAAEGRTAWLWNNLNNGSWFGRGAVLERNDIYTYAAPGCGFGAEISSANVTWSRVANNRFFGGGASVFSSVSANGGGTEGNTFAPLAALPAWGGPGDPRQVPPDSA